MHKTITSVLTCLFLILSFITNATATAEIMPNELIIKYKIRPIEERQLEQQELIDLGLLKAEDAKEITPPLTKDIISSITKYFELKLEDKFAFSKISAMDSVYSKHENAVLLKLANTNNIEELEEIIETINTVKLKHESFSLEAAYPNYLYHTTSVTPNDTLYKDQWALKNIQATEAWTKSKGQGITVAVIDTGVDTDHPDLISNIWTNKDEIPNNGIDDDKNGFIDDINGWDFVKDGGASCAFIEDCHDRDNDPNDIHGHGTHVAGIIAASQNNQLGISGVAPEAKIMALRAGFTAGSTGAFKTTDIIAAINYAINNDADIINMSFAGSGLGILAELVELADKSNVVMVAAAGNANSSRKAYPAALDQVISVGAHTPSMTRASFSNYGDWLDLTAPGFSIISTTPNGTYSRKSGTSMAAPYVAGVAALIKSKNTVNELRSESIKNMIITALGNSNFDDVKELGALNANNINYSFELDRMEVPASALLNTSVRLDAFSLAPADEQIIEYEWNSDLDGYLGSDATLILDNLSKGVHTISCSALSSSGARTGKVFKNIVISSKNNMVLNNTQASLIKIIKKRGLLRARVARSARSRIREYRWVSNVDGFISNQRVVPSSELSPGFHKLTLLVKDKDGNWSQTVERIISIRLKHFLAKSN